MVAPTDRDNEFAIRPPRQERTRQAWTRILDAGVAIIEEGGYEAFTIAAVCERAQVAPRAIYDRTTSKDALFLAVYEHGLSIIRADEEVFDRPERWAGLDARTLAEKAVAEVAGIFERHGAFLKPIVLLSGAHPEVYRRGRVYTARTADRFTALLLGVRDQITHSDPESAVRLCFSTVFASLVLRIAYGPGFAAPAVDTDAFTRHLAQTAVRYLFGRE
ncbi:helix-turn-helix domain-containing protein [Streptomyces sp. NPDC046862]|uniref:TetR/AcrR family transcriptional regulator n=1 Tax=Streptomyces sp. NPDC046862 TaxID=3154603 RepID=UPI003452E990